ncbi:MAG TPA: hypothetical protein VK509_17230, partial [Polyangiales bacterium]|nr:hypothetical protein [Polyangiales bacterium]
LDPGELHEMFLSVLADVLPIERFDTRGARCVPIEDGTRRAIFVAIDSRDISVSFGGKPVSDEHRRTTGAFTFVTVDQPAAGQWEVSGTRHDARVLVLLESALRMRCGVSLRAQGEAITVWAELAQGMAPVRNADLRASVYRPGESIGELLTSFAQSGELISACRARHIDPSVSEPGGALLTTARALLVVTPQRKDRFSLRPDGDDELGAQDEPRAPQRVLLDAVERARDLPFQSQRQSLRLSEVRPGRYEAQLPASDAQHEGTYTFRVRALGCTPDGYAFARDQRTSIAIAPIPDAKNSAAWIEEAHKPAADGTRSWLATVQPRTRLDKPLGPGLIRNLRLEYADQDDGKRLHALRTHDNFDGTYSARFETPAGAPAPALALRYRLAGAGTVATVPLRGRVTAGKRVRVILNELRIGEADDRCLLPDPASKQGGKLLKFDVVAAINGNPNRAVRKHVKSALPAGQGARCGIELSEVVFDGHVEPGAALDLAIGETDFDWMKLLAGDPAELRYRQVFRVVDHAQGSHAVPLFAQPDQPGRRRPWKVWLTVLVE